jgi:hypothetical protein
MNKLILNLVAVSSFNTVSLVVAAVTTTFNVRNELTGEGREGGVQLHAFRRRN